jgi:hypothetical protein
MRPARPSGEGTATTASAWIRALTTAGTVLGVLVIAYGVVTFALAGSLAALLIAVAIVVVGPGEDALQAWVRRRAATPEQGEAAATIVDRATSVAFLLLLMAAIAVR